MLSFAKKILSVFKILLPFHASAWKATSEPIRRMLEEGDEAKRDKLTANWRESTQTQLSTISVTSALLGGVIAASFTWPVLAQLSHSTQSTVLAIWYSALVLALTSIAASAQQSVALTRLGSHPEGLDKIRKLLGRHIDGKWKPSNLQLIVWQAPLSLLNFSVVMFTVGLGTLVWSSVSPAWIGDDVKIVTLFTLTLVYSVGLYAVCAYGLYTRIYPAGAKNQAQP